VVNYVIAASPSLLNFMIADTQRVLEPARAPVPGQRAPARAGQCRADLYHRPDQRDHEGTGLVLDRDLPGLG
jgi:hypothetical protein